MFISHYLPGEIGHLVHKDSPLFQIIWHGLHKSVLQQYGTEQEVLIESSEIFLPIEYAQIKNGPLINDENLLDIDHFRNFNFR